MPETLLLVADEPAVLHSLYRILKRDGHDVLTASSGEDALQVLAVERIAVCVAGLQLPGIDGLELLRRARSENAAGEFILFTESADVETAVRAVRAGAWDVISKPFSKERFEHAVQAALARYRQRRGASSPLPGETTPLLGESAAMRAVLDLIERVGPSAATVLVQGESGTGKELVAAALQRRSLRSSGPFVKVNCAAISDTLMESELFGYEKGAFTGAVRSKKGRFELADGGTIFLDEIGDMSASTQMKVLRVLQEGEFDRVGGTRTQKVDVRVIAATHVDLESAVAARRFRGDLYYRLRVIEIRLPPLRERKEDIPLLVGHFLRKYSERNRKRITGVEPEVLDVLVEHDWPGNVRELENAVERAVVMTRSERLRCADFGHALPERPPQLAVSFPIGTRLEDMERRMIAETLRWTNGDKTRAASLLGITARTIYRRLERRRRELAAPLPPETTTAGPEPADDRSLAASVADPFRDDA